MTLPQDWYETPAKLRFRVNLRDTFGETAIVYADPCIFRLVSQTVAANQMPPPQRRKKSFSTGACASVAALHLGNTATMTYGPVLGQERPLNDKVVRGATGQNAVCPGRARLELAEAA